MRFFIPSAENSKQSEDVYRAIRSRVAAESGGVSERRIYHVNFRHDGHAHTAVVGSDGHGLGRGAVIAIFEGLDGFFYVCTSGNSLFDAQPHPVQTSAIIDAEDFSALA